MIFNVGAGGSSTADKLKYDNSKSSLTADNVQAAIDEIDESLSGETLWEQTITSKMTFGATDVTVSNIEEYSHYEIFCVGNNDSAINRACTSGRIPVGYGTFISAGIHFRSVSYSNKIFSFSLATKTTDSSTNNIGIIPFKIVGYKY